MYIAIYQWKAFSTSFIYKTAFTPTVFSDSDMTSICLRVSCLPHLTMYIVIFQCKAFSTSFVHKTAATPAVFSDSDTTSVCLCVSRHDHFCT